MRGRRAVAEQAGTYRRLASGARPALVDGTAGLVVFAGERPSAVLGFTIRRGRIAELDIFADPERHEVRESIALAFVAALQHLPPRQRAVLQRARAMLDGRLPPGSREGARLPDPGRERELVDRFAAAFERGDTDTIVALLSDDARLTMPPEPHEYEGPAAIAAFLRDRDLARGAHLRLVPVRANGQPAFGCYLPDAHTAIAPAYVLIVLTLDGERIRGITYFRDRGLFSFFVLPERCRVPERSARHHWVRFGQEDEALRGMVRDRSDPVSCEGPIGMGEETKWVTWSSI